MFKAVIIDLIGMSIENGLFKALKTASNCQLSEKKLKEDLTSDYYNLILGKYDESLFWEKLKLLANSRKKILSIKNNFLTEIKFIIDKSAISLIRENFKLGVLSDFHTNWWNILKKKHKLELDAVVLSSELRAGMPDNSLFNKILFLLKTIPDEAIFVSDSINDLLAAKKYGIKTVFIPGRDKRFTEADYSYSSLSEFLAIL